MEQCIEVVQAVYDMHPALFFSNDFFFFSRVVMVWGYFVMGTDKRAHDFEPGNKMH